MIANLGAVDSAKKTLGQAKKSEFYQNVTVKVAASGDDARYVRSAGIAFLKQQRKSSDA